MFIIILNECLINSPVQEANHNPPCQANIDKIIYVYTLSEEERKTLIDRGQKRLLFFSWKESAQKLETVYKMCL